MPMQRKTVTVVFCDVTGSTELGESTDPEALRAVLARYFERMKGVVEAHGGSVEKFIGDAVMAVFGVPVTHEDDALRACRAAVEMRDAFPELGLDARAVRGRCLSYGDGITYWPVVEILKQLGTLPEGDAALPLRALLGESETPAPAAEIAWGFRKLLEQEAQAQPLVCLLDDLH